MKNRPHVAILVGPFVDDRHGRIAAGETDGKTYKVRSHGQKLMFSKENNNKNYNFNKYLIFHLIVSGNLCASDDERD